MRGISKQWESPKRKHHRKCQQNTLRVWTHPEVSDNLHPVPSTRSMKSGADTVEITQRPCWGEDKKGRIQRVTRAESPGQHMPGNVETVCSLQVTGSPRSAEDTPLWCSKGSGQRGNRAGSRRPPGHSLVQRNREGRAIEKGHFSRKQNVCGNSEAESIATVKYRSCLSPAPLYTHTPPPQRTVPQTARAREFKSFYDEQ